MEYNKDILEKSNSFCIAPWVSIHTWPDGKTYPCCLWNSRDPIGNVNNEPLDKIWNNKRMKETRKAFLKGEKLKSSNVKVCLIKLYFQLIKIIHHQNLGYVCSFFQMTFYVSYYLQFAGYYLDI